jgi:hypothetical protein
MQIIIIIKKKKKKQKQKKQQQQQQRRKFRSSKESKVAVRCALSLDLIVHWGLVKDLEIQETEIAMRAKMRSLLLL